VELGTFIEMLARLSGEDVRVVAKTINEHHTTVGDEVDAWEALMRIDDELRATGRSRIAAVAAFDASQVVQTAARAGGIDLPDEAVTRVAREAALVARGIVAGEGAHTAVSHLLRDWPMLFAA
jgi:hypothetical protein